MQIYKLSILLITYNHEKYIHRAMQSILGQLITGPVELIIADDGSSDQTREIIQSYDNVDPRFHFKYLDHLPNRGITKNYQRGFAACSGQYVSIMEGDDYWCSPHKLQRQCDFLDIHWQCDLCSVNYYVYEEIRCKFTPRTNVGLGIRYLGARELIADNLVGNFSTCMYRKSALEELPSELFEITSYDWIVNICISTRSLIGFIEEPMSVYRVHDHGVWSKSSHVEKIMMQLEMIPYYDKITKHMFKPEFNCLAVRLKQSINISEVMDVSKNLDKPLVSLKRYIFDMTPPIFILIAKIMIPPGIKRIISKFMGRGHVL